MEESLNIYQKLAKVRKQVEVLQKNKSGYGYRYVTEDEILANIKGSMNRHALSLEPCILRDTLQVQPVSYQKTRMTKGGEVYQETVNEVLATAEMTWTWINDENPEERVVIDWVLVGQQADASQAFGAGLTYSSRYFLLKFFNVATTDADPDEYRSKQKAAEAAEDKLIASQIVQKFDEQVRAFLAESPDQAEAVKKLAARFVKNGNYLAISDPSTATKLLAAFRAEFQKEE
jgi:hypothetical protein